MKREIGVVALQSLNGVEYDFTNWLHGGFPTQLITTPTDDITYTAIFSPVLNARDNTTTLIYPNPAGDLLYLINTQVSSITITDMVGKNWDLRIDKANASVLDVRNLPEGIYLLNFSLNQTFFRYRLLIQR